MNIGIGYTLPFQVFGAVWLDANQLKSKLESYDIEGVSFRTIWYKPFSGSQRGLLLKGLQFFFTDYQKARITEVQFHVMQAVAELYPDKKAFSVVNSYGLFDKVCGTDFIRKELSRTYTFESVKEYWRKDEEAFSVMAKRYWLYPL